MKRPAKTKAKAMNIPEDDADQEIGDDGMDVVQLGNADSAQSDTSVEEEDDMDEGDEEDGGAELDAMEWDGLGSKGAHQNGHSKSDVAPPTTKDIKMVHEASDLFGSNAFKLKIDALLLALVPKLSYTAPLEKCLFDIHSVISSLTEIAPQHPLRAAEALKDQGVSVVFPLPPPSEETNWTVRFSKPTDIKVVGSWANKLSVPANDGHGLEVDLALEMSPDLFQPKDHLNNRFFHKRAFYLAVVAAALASSPKLSLDVMYDSPQADARRTCITLRSKPTGSPSDFTKLNASIRIHLSLSPDTSPIPLSRLSPSHSNLRLAASNPDLPSLNPPTPLYNNTLLQSFTPTAHLLSIYHYKSHIPSFANALSLLRVWANQRGFACKGKRVVRGFEVIGGAWWGFILGMLVYGPGPGADGRASGKRKPLGIGLSSYQLFRGAMDYLANYDLSTDSVFMKSTEALKFPTSEFVAHHGTSFVDPSMTFNFLAGVPLESLHLLRHDAKVTLRTLDRDENGFDWTFMRDLRDLPTRFDTVIRVDLAGAMLRTESGLEVLDHGSQASALLNSLSPTLRKALGTRITHCAILHSSSSPRPLNLPIPPTNNTIEIGLLLNPFEAGRLVDHGPAAGDEAAGADFRAFWGSKAELRRFKDGSIVESVVWEVPNTEERIHIPIMVVQHILDLHFGVPKAQVTTIQASYDLLLRSPTHEVTATIGSGPVPTFRQGIVAFDELFRTVKALRGDLPLSITQILPASEYLRHTSILPAVPLDTTRFSNLPDSAKYLPAIDVILAFEGSTRWPDDLAAIQKVKLAFLEQIARALKDQKVVKHATVVLDADAGVIEDNCALELITSTGYAFRGRIHCDVEKSLLEKFIAPKQKHWSVPVAYAVTKSQAKAALVVHKRRFIHGPQHHSAIAALQQRSPSYGSTTRLIKRWLGAHMLAPYVPVEIIELICAHVYLCPGPFNSPATALTGFARVIRLLKEWRYSDTPLYVPQYTAAGVDPGASVIFPANKRAEADQIFKSRVGVVGWTVVTEEDPSGVLFGTVLGPKGLVAARIRQVATATWECLDSGMNALFKHPLDDYDFVVHLNPSFLLRYSQNTHYDPTKLPSAASRYKNLETLHPSAYGPTPRVDFDPATLFYQDLKRIYADTALFFYDPLGGAVMGGLWYPQIRNRRPFKVFAGYSTIPASDGDPKKPLVSLNEKAVLAEIERLGNGLITKIVSRT
ncbi:hypothetical protein FRB94_013424 [Tulasnella sp. JGI-2019a]|nr:hypothetical protein FRB94_013424 [Tulasnella sp. JGI-2019a]